MQRKCLSRGTARCVFQSNLDFLQLVGEENRLRILCLLKNGPRCVCEIWSALGLSQNLASHHLSVLKTATLVTSRREGLKVIYRLKGERLARKLKKLNLFLN